ncbi:T9SS type A sorting domain-containing protein [bacterium]|nr:T9SS type A sorting domain-containing protein [bacterium]
MRRFILLIGALLLPALLANAQVEVRWVQAMSGTTHRGARAIDHAPGGGFYAAGYINSLSGSTDFYLVRTDSMGLPLWEAITDNGGREYAFDVLAAPDGGCYVAGYSSAPSAGGLGGRNAYLARYDADGNLLWDEVYGGPGHDGFNAAAFTTDGDIILAGYVGSPVEYLQTPPDACLWKVDPNGELIWERVYSGDDGDRFTDVHVTLNGDIYATGYTGSQGHGNRDFILLHADENGDSLDYTPWGSSASDWAYDLVMTSDGDFLMAGRSDIHGSDFFQAALRRVSADGNHVFSRKYGESDFYDYAHCALETSDGNYIAAGITKTPENGQNDVYLFEVDTDGFLLWSWRFGDSASTEYVFDMLPVADREFVLTGYTSATDEGTHGVLLLKVEVQVSSVGNTTHPLPTTTRLESIHPNPFNDCTTIRFTLQSPGRAHLAVFDLLGREVAVLRRGTHAAGQYDVPFHATGAAAGIYFVRLETEQGRHTQKMVLLR